MQTDDALLNLSTSILYYLSRINKGTDSQRLDGAQRISVLSVDHEAKNVIIDANGIHVLRCHLAGHTNTELIQHVTRSLFNLSVISSGRKAIVEENGFVQLHRTFMSNYEHSAICTNIMGALANLAIELEHKITLVNMGILPLLVNLLKESENDALIRQSCRLLFALSALDSNKCIIIECGALPPLLRCLSYSTTIQEYAAGAIANLAICASGKNKIIDIGGLHPLSMLAKHATDSKVLKQVSRAFFAISSVASNRPLIVKEGVLPDFMRFLTHETADVQANAGGTISNLALTDECRCLIVTKFNGFEPLLRLARNINNGSGQSMYKAAYQAVRGLYILSNPLPPVEFIGNNWTIDALDNDVQTLIQILQAFDSDLQVYAAGILVNITHENPHIRKEIVRLKGVPLLIERLVSYESKVKIRVLQALANIACDVEHISHIIQAGALPHMMLILHEKQIELQNYVCLVLYHMAVTDDAQASIVQHKALPRLLELSSSPDTNVQKQAISCLDRLGISHIPPIEQNSVPSLRFLCENMLGDNLENYAQTASHNIPTILQMTTCIPAPRLQGECLLYCMENLLYPKYEWQTDMTKHMDDSTYQFLRNMGARWGFIPPVQYAD